MDHQYLEASHSLEASKLLAEIGQPDRVMEDPVSAKVITVRTTDNTNEGQILTVSTSNSIKNTEAADGEGNDTRADATGPSVAIGGVAGVELVAAADDVEPGLGDQMVEQGEVEVAGNREDVGDANLNEPASQVATQGGLTGTDHSWSNRVLDGRCGGAWWATHVVARGFTRVYSSNLGVHGN